MATQTNATTKACIAYLQLNGFNVWRNNNGAVYSKARGCYLKNPLHKQGVSDIIGYHKKSGKAIFVEIKTGKDKLSIEQYDFLEQARFAGCYAFDVKTLEDLQVKLIDLKTTNL